MTPSFMLEGLAVYQETNQAAGYGRLQGTGYDMQMRMEVASGEVKSLNQVAVASREWPLGYNYLYGAYFVQYLADTYGDEKVGEFLTSYSRKVIPFFCLIAPREPRLAKISSSCGLISKVIFTSNTKVT